MPATPMMCTSAPSTGLQGPRLSLVPATAADLPYLQRLWDDPAVRRFLFDDQPVPMERAAAALRMCRDATPRGGGLWMIRPTEGGPSIGCIGLYEADASALLEPRLAGLLEPVVALEPARWGQGYAVEALRALLHHAFDRLALPALGAAHDVPNVASGRMLERAGFVVLGDRPTPRHALRTYRLSRDRWARLGGPAA